MKPGWRWAVIGAAVLFAALAASAWHKQRLARQPETTKPVPAVTPSSRAGAQAVKPALPAAEARQGGKSARSSRDRTERERAGRP
jgi:hypothetical protein